MNKSDVVAMALEAGFSECRIARANKAAHSDLFEKWLKDGKHGTMEWMEKDPERRMDPRIVVPGAKSVIVLALNYYQKDPKLKTDGATGRFARYAWGEDYHGIIEKKVKLLVRTLREAGGDHRFYVDYGPVLERDFATESGIGWNGKSTMQVHPNMGSWFFLAEIITTLEMEPDSPVPDQCGKCTACLKACPTNAITHVRRLDARRCISYHTIENKGPIPEEYRRAMGDRIFGCDACIDACPWNEYAQESRETRFAVRPFVNEMKLRDFLELDDTEFRKLFRKSPVKRTGRSRFFRNVCVALGNVGTKDDLPALRRAAASDDQLVSEHAKWAIREIQERTGSAKTLEAVI
ncbi:MAG: tRNA epoxyqueuosine(34) reductase QueG [Verrucomicrobiota bacterium]